MSTWSKAQAKQNLKKTKGTNRWRPMKPRAIRTKWIYKNKSQELKRPPTMTDAVVWSLEYIFSIDWTKEEACALANIAPSTFDGWYDKPYTISWKFSTIVYNPATQKMEKKTIKRDATFKEIMDTAMAQPFVRARQAQAKAIVAWKERTLDNFMSSRDPRYSKKFDVKNTWSISVTIWTPQSPFVKKPKDKWSEKKK